jgi:hypothetical protein
MKDQVRKWNVFVTRPIVKGKMMSLGSRMELVVRRVVEGSD